MPAPGQEIGGRLGRLAWLGGFLGLSIRSGEYRLLRFPKANSTSQDDQPN